MKIDYQLEYRKQLQRNISLVRNEINNTDFVIKITNHADKFGREYDEVKSKIMDDDMYAEWFAKDPAKQNIYEKLAASYISKVENVEDFINLPSNTKMFVINGQITSDRLNDVKSIDGGAQDNQYNDIRNFLRNCNKVSSGNNYYIAICDGPYFDRKIQILNNDFGSSNVIAMNIDYLEDFINKIKL